MKSNQERSIFKLIEENDLEALKVMIEAKPEVLLQANCDGDTPAILAAYNGHTEALKVMIEAKPEVLFQANREGYTLAIAAAYNGHTEALKVMIETNPEVLRQVNREGNTPALAAAWNGDTEALKVMIETNPEVLRQANRDGHTPAIVAAYHGHTEALKVMIEAKPEVLLQADRDGTTPAIFATMRDHFEALKVMIEAKPEVLLQADSLGSTPAIRAAYYGSTKALEFMIETNPAVLLQADNLGNTPAFAAAYHGHTEALKVMIETNPEVLRQANSDGNTPETMAEVRGNLKIINLIHFYTSGPNEEFPTKSSIDGLLDTIVTEVQGLNIDLASAVDAQQMLPLQVEKLNALFDKLENQIEILNEAFGNIFPELREQHTVLQCLFAISARDMESAVRLADDIVEMKLKNPQMKIHVFEIANQFLFLEESDPEKKDQYEQLAAKLFECSGNGDFFRRKFSPLSESENEELRQIVNKLQKFCEPRGGQAGFFSQVYVDGLHSIKIQLSEKKFMRSGYF